MSSYQQLYLGGIVPQDSTPDYLTCGHCAREFLLANITLFIAHKAVGCDGSTNKLSTESMQDTSSPLTCSVCSRVFLTARGLLQHAEQDHNMQLCLKKGPLIISENTVHPPPAHTSLSRSEYDVSDMLNRPVRGCDDKENDEPTDLSMSCSNKMGKAIIKCSDDECKITIKPNYAKENEDLDTSLSTSTLPKKRKFVYGQSGQLDELQAFRETHKAWPTFELIDDVDGFGDETSITDDTRRHNFKDGDENPFQLKPDPEVKMLVRAQYENERLCCVSVSTEKSKGNRADELSDVEDLSTANAHLINSVCDKTCCSESSEPCSSNSGGTQTTQLIYKLPKQVPHNPESAKPILVKSSPDERGWNASSMTQMVTTSSPTVAMASTTITPPGVAFSPSSSTAFSAVLPVSSSESSSSHYPTTVPSSGPSALLPWKENLTDYSDDRSGQFMSNSVSDVVADEFQILRVKSPPLSASAPPTAHKTTPNNHFSLMTQSPRLMTPQSNPLHSGFDFDISPVPCKSSDELALTGSLDAQAFDLNNGGGLSSAYDDPASIPVGIDASLMHSNITDLSFKSPSLDAFEEGNMGSEKQITKFAPFKRSPIGHEESPDSQESPTSNPDGDDQTLNEAQQLKKRRYPTSKPFQCSQCDQAFNQRIHLKKHMSKHTGVKPFKCIQCDYSTVERSHLKVHYRVHTGEKPFKCPFCEYATAQNSTLKIHLKRHHHGLQNPKRSKFSVRNSSSGGHTQDISLDSSQDPLSSRRFRGPAVTIPNAEREQFFTANFNMATDKANSEKVLSSNLDHCPEISISSSTCQLKTTKPSEHDSLDSHYNNSQKPANTFTERTGPNCKTSSTSATLTSLLTKPSLTSSFGSNVSQSSIIYSSQVKQVTTRSPMDNRGHSLPPLQSSVSEDHTLTSAQKAPPLLNFSETWFSQGKPSHSEDTPDRGSVESHGNCQKLTTDSSFSVPSHDQPNLLLRDSACNQREKVDHKAPENFMLSMPEDVEGYQSTIQVHPTKLQVVIADKDFVRG